MTTGIVTLLFTDIEGSTALLTRLGGAAYTAVLEDHHRIIRSSRQTFAAWKRGLRATPSSWSSRLRVRVSVRRSRCSGNSAPQLARWRRAARPYGHPHRAGVRGFDRHGRLRGAL
jgi:hypothetical protein